MIEIEVKSKMDITENKKSTLSGDKKFLLPKMGKTLIITEKPSMLFLSPDLILKKAAAQKKRLYNNEQERNRVL